MTVRVVAVNHGVRGETRRAAEAALAECVRKADALDRIRAEVEREMLSRHPGTVGQSEWCQMLDLIDREVAS